MCDSLHSSSITQLFFTQSSLWLKLKFSDLTTFSDTLSVELRIKARMHSSQLSTYPYCCLFYAHLYSLSFSLPSLIHSAHIYMQIFRYNLGGLQKSLRTVLFYVGCIQVAALMNVIFFAVCTAHCAGVQMCSVCI